MPNQKYRRGAAVEYKAKAFLENHGFHVMRSAGSKGIFDIVAFKVEDGVMLVRLVQCKSTIAEYNTIKKDYNSVFEHRTDDKNCSVELWIYEADKGFTTVYISNARFAGPKKATTNIVGSNDKW